MDNQQLTSGYLVWLRTKRYLQPGTLSKYAGILAAYEAWEDEPFPTRTPEDVEEFIAERPRRGGLPPSPATVTLEVAVLAGFYRWGMARLGWADNPAALAAKPRVHNRQPRPVPDDVWLSIWDAQGLPDDARVALGLGYFCGLRRAEITSLHGNQVWGRHLVNFVRKGGGEDRFDYGDVLDHFAVTMPHLQSQRWERPLQWLARTRGPQLLLPWDERWIQPNALNKRLRYWLDDAGMDADSFTPHMLRHSFATNLLASGVGLDLASDLCNHSSPAITMRYIKTSGGRLRAIRESLGAASSGRK